MTDLEAARIDVAQLERQAQALFISFSEAQSELNAIGKQLGEKERELAEAKFKLRHLEQAP